MTTCAKCNKPLTVELDPDSSDTDSQDQDVSMDDSSNATDTVPDDVQLLCNCHFHWQCLLDSYELAKCPNCGREIATSAPEGQAGSSSRASGQQMVLVNLNNEGGMQEQINILPILEEESYLRAFPGERKCRAFLEFCREGDHHAIVDLLKSCDEEAGEGEGHADMEDDGEEDAGPGKSSAEVLRYQDPMGDMQSGLHIAVANGHREVAWLLLLLASELPELEFPALVYQEAATMGIMREWQEGKTDVRGLKDAQGRTAEDVAREAGVVWTGWVGNGRLALP